MGVRKAVRVARVAVRRVRCSESGSERAVRGDEEGQ